jgi:aminomethyltransferase
VLEAGAPEGIRPIGPNHANRIEAGLLAYGCDIDETTNPYEVDMGYSWMVDLDQPEDFHGKSALRRIRARGPRRRLVGVDLDGPDLGTFHDGGMPRPLPVIVDGQRVGKVTSACRSPRLDRNIGYAMVEAAHAGLGSELDVEHPVHGTLRAAAVSKPHWPASRQGAARTGV